MEQLLTPEQVAQLLAVKESTIYQWTYRQFIPHVKCGRSVRFSPAAIEAWVRKRSLSGRAKETPRAVLGEPINGKEG